MRRGEPGMVLSAKISCARPLRLRSLFIGNVDAFNRGITRQRRNLLKSHADGILARDNPSLARNGILRNVHGCSTKPVRRREASAMCACQRLTSAKFVDNIKN